MSLYYYADEKKSSVQLVKTVLTGQMFKLHSNILVSKFERLSCSIVKLSASLGYTILGNLVRNIFIFHDCFSREIFVFLSTDSDKLGVCR